MRYREAAAREIAAHIGPEGVRARAWTDVAVAQSRADQPAARASFDQAVQAAGGIGNAHSRARAPASSHY